MKDLTFKLADDNGILTEYKILKLLEDKSKNIKYILYTDDVANLYASRYRIVNKDIIVEPVLEDDEWTFIEENSKEVIDGQTL